MAMSSFVSCRHCGEVVSVAGTCTYLAYWRSEEKCPKCGQIQNVPDDPEELLP